MTNALAHPEPTALAAAASYAVLKFDAAELSEVLRENLGESGAGAGDLDRVKVPAGGGKRWEVPTLEGSEDPEELTGILVGWQDRKAYWPVQLEEGGGGNPPDCTSDDMVTGVGNPGGECRVCPYNQFGSAARGEGKACKDMRLLFLVREGDFLPLVISVPASSLANVRRYFQRLAGRGFPYYGVVTTLRLQQAKSNSGVTYSEIAPALVGPIGKKERARVKAYSEAVRAAFGAIRIDAPRGRGSAIDRQGVDYETGETLDGPESEGEAKSRRRGFLFAQATRAAIRTDDRDAMRRLCGGVLGREVVSVGNLEGEEYEQVGNWVRDHPMEAYLLAHPPTEEDADDDTDPFIVEPPPAPEEQPALLAVAQAEIEATFAQAKGL